MKKALKLCSVILALALCLSMTATVFAEGTEFSDISEADWFYPAVRWGANAGITYGVGDGVFGPDGEVTRAQVVTFLWRMQGQPLPAAPNTFDDVEEGSWYEIPVQWAVENGITFGTGDNKFSPDIVCDRAMCITLLYRVSGSPLDGTDFSAEIGINENSLPEDWGFYFLKEMVMSLRELIFDVPEGAYFEYPVLWAALSGIITDENITADENEVRFRPYDPCVRKEMISFMYQANLEDDQPMIYENGAVRLPIPQKYSELLAIDVNFIPDEEEGTLYTVSELASREAVKNRGDEYEGAGEIFSVDRVSEETLHELLCSDMSGMNVFAKDYAGNYYIFRTPTDVRFERETTEKMYEDAAIWTELGEWAQSVPYDILQESSYITPEKYSNTDLDMYLARIAYKGDTNYTVSTTEFGPIEPVSVDGKYYAELLIESGFEISGGETVPDGEYAVLNFPEEDIRFDFFMGDKTLVRETRGEYVTYYRYKQRDAILSTDIMFDWYEAMAVDIGKKEADTSLDAYEGYWHEEIAGRGQMTVIKLLKMGRFAKIEVVWPDSAAVSYYWDAVGYLTDGGEVLYYDGTLSGVEYDANGIGDLFLEDNQNSGSLKINDDGKLVWHYRINGEEMTAVFVKNN